ncbi:hypothetical protein [Pectinatus frisingensis]|uniref:hypothetical protein n=1 Tax=Pectinatus frisingensis TaxID=865 RepID=UPI0018C73941|nr:hypothetical protein [Pectinatus frisingensis]
MRQRKSSLISYIEKRFYQYEKIKKAVWEARNDSGIGRTGGNSTGHAFVSDPTANVAVKEVMPIKSVTIKVCNDTETIKQPEKWLQVIEATYNHYSEGIVVDLLKCRYSNEPYQQTCMNLHISTSLYYQMLIEARQYALACACQVGLVKVF